MSFFCYLKVKFGAANTSKIIFYIKFAIIKP